MEKIALFGTSADPPTIGHQTILRWLAQHYDRVVVWASDNPFKQHPTPLSDRTKMLDLAIADINSTHNNISVHPELSDRRTLITVNKAKETWGDSVFTLVIGSDILSQITSWYRISKLLEQVQLLIVPRVGYEINQQDLNALTELGGRFAIAPLDAPEVSSSTYRMQKDRNLISPTVADYILQHNLYNESSEVINNK